MMGAELLDKPWREWPLALTYNQAATLLNVSRKVVRRLVEEGVLVGLQYGTVQRPAVTRASVVETLKLDVD